MVLGPDGVRVLLDSSSLQIAGAIAAAVQAGVSREQASQETAGGQQGKESIINTRYIFGYDLKMMDTVGPAILGLVVFFFTFIFTILLILIIIIYRTLPTDGFIFF